MKQYGWEQVKQNKLQQHHSAYPYIPSSIYLSPYTVSCLIYPTLSLITPLYIPHEPLIHLHTIICLCNFPPSGHPSITHFPGDQPRVTLVLIYSVQLLDQVRREWNSFTHAHTHSNTQTLMHLWVCLDYMALSMEPCRLVYLTKGNEAVI